MYSLIWFLGLLSYVTVQTDFVPDITLLSSKTKNKLSIICVAGKNINHSAITLITPLKQNDSQSNINYESITYSPKSSNLSNAFPCNFEPDSKCSKTWIFNYHKIQSSDEYDFAPVTDARWENFQTYVNKLSVLNITTDKSHKFKVTFSVRTNIDTSIFLCSNASEYNKTCYAFSINEPDEKMSNITLRLCTNFNKTKPYIEDSGCKHLKTKQGIMLNEGKWEHFAISRDHENDSIRVSDQHKLLLEYKGNETYFIKNVILSNRRKVIMWKIHNYTFLSLNYQDDEYEIGPIIPKYNNINLCVSLYIAVCPTCSLNITLATTSKQISGHQKQTDTKSGDQMWHYVTLIAPAAENVKLKVQLKYNTENKFNGFWLIDDVRQCYEDEIRVIRTNISISNNETDIISCEALQYPNWSSKIQGGIVQQSIISDQFCEQLNTIGVNCNISCKDVMNNKNDTHCNKHAICKPVQNNETTLMCTCSSGYTGKYCRDPCPGGNYGYNCKNTCGACENGLCLKSSGNCPNNKCVTGYTGNLCKNLIYPRLRSAPEICQITLTSITVCFKNISTMGQMAAKTFQIQYMQKLDTQWTKWTNSSEILELNLNTNVSIENLNPETHYEIRAIVFTSEGMSIQKSDIPKQKAFTFCKGNNSFENIKDVKIVENSYDINIQWTPVCNFSYNISYHCKDPWCMDTKENNTILQTMQKEHKIENLTPYTTYNIQWPDTFPKYVKENYSMIRTSQAEPPAIRNLTVYSIGKDYVRLKWLPPYPPNGPIKSYKIFSYYPDDPNIKTYFLNFEKVLKPCQIWENYTCFSIEKNIIKEKIRVRIWAINDENKQGQKMETESLYLKQARSVPPENLTATWEESNKSMILTWHYPNKTNGDLNKFKINVMVINHNNTQSIVKVNDTDVITEKRVYSCKVENVSHASTYQIEVIGVNEFEGEPAKINCSTPPPVPVLQGNISINEMSNISITYNIPGSTEDSLICDGYMYVVACDPTPGNNTFHNDLHSNISKWIYCQGKSWILNNLKTSNRSTSVVVVNNFTAEMKNRKAITHYNVSVVLINNYTGIIRHKVYSTSNDFTSRYITPMTEEIHSNSALYALFLLLLLPVTMYFVYKYVQKKKMFPEYSTSLHGNSTMISTHNNITNQNLSQNNNSSTELQTNSTGLVPVSNIVKPNIKKMNTNVGSDNSNEPLIENSDGSTYSRIVKIKELSDYVKESLENGELKQQHALFPKGQTKPWEYGTLKENKFKNRYNNLSAYDHSRVVLKKMYGDSFSDFINANYVDGYEQKKAYIATQGPRPTTIIDFWRMIWQENVKYIVMLANVVEGGKRKCEKYWPDVDTTEEFINIIVKFIKTDVYADFEYRTFEVTCANETRYVQHLHFTSWPDHGVPLYPQSLVPFLKHILTISLEKAPIVVHCSAGVGRTGTIILADICLRMAAKEGQIDVLKYLQIIREQRVNLVDNVDQYKLVHMVILECLLAPDTQILCNNHFSSTVEKMIKEGEIQKQMVYLRDTAWHHQAMGMKTEPILQNTSKNRFLEIIPEFNKIYISRYPCNDEYSDYINAVPVDGFRIKNQFIVTQCPLPHTVGDFWRMIYENNVRVIVSLNEININDKTSCIFWPAEPGISTPVPHYVVRYNSIKAGDFYDIYNLQLENKNAEEGSEFLSVKLVQFKNWKREQALPPDMEQFINMMEEAQSLARDGSPMVVTCYNGAKASGLFVALSFVIEKIKLEQICDVCLAVRVVRNNRVQFITNKNQFEFLYRAANTYLESFGTYSNFPLSFEK